MSKTKNPNHRKGRPAAVINLPKTKFTVNSLFLSLGKRYTKVTVGKFVKESFEKGKICIIGEKIVHPSGKGRPEKEYLLKEEVKKKKIKIVRKPGDKSTKYPKRSNKIDYPGTTVSQLPPTINKQDTEELIDTEIDYSPSPNKEMLVTA